MIPDHEYRELSALSNSPRDCLRRPLASNSGAPPFTPLTDILFQFLKVQGPYRTM